MKPIFFKECSGWFHPAAGRCGVVLCGAYGQEELFTHRAWRAFAMRLAASGFPALRFDYHGTGDSAGDDQQPGRVRAWLDSVQGAVDWMRYDAGLSRVALVGFRLGALLAACAADEIGGVDALVMMATTASGGAFLHELKALARFASPIPDEPPPPPDHAKDFEAAGFVLSAETQAGLKALDLTAFTKPPAPKVLLLNRTDTKPLAVLPTHLRELGAEVREEEFPEYQRLLRTTHGEPVPERPFSLVTDWLAEQFPENAAASSPLHTPTIPEAAPDAHLLLPGLEERPVFLDSHRTLYGVFGKALGAQADPGLPVFVFVNNGAIHHVGTNRMSVMLARRLALQGFSSLRFDIGGIGDSASRPGREDGLLYCKDSYTDLKVALDWLETRGHTRFVTVGLCAGGTLALTGAVRDPRVVGQVLINPGRFFLGDGETTQALVAKAVRPAGDYIRMLVRPSAWRNLLSGRRNLSTVLPGLARRGVNAVLRALKRTLLGTSAVADGPNQVERWFRGMSKRGVATLMVYSVGDFTLGQFEAHLGKDGSKLRGLKNVRVEFLSAADHSLTRRYARERLAKRLETYANDVRRNVLPVPIDRAS